MELRHLRYFVTVAEELNFSKAALKLYTAQPSLSQQIKDLEEDVGVQLLYRTKRKVELTEEGAVFLEQARLTLAQADKAIMMARKVSQAKQQCLRIGFVPVAEVQVFPHVLPNFRAHHPELRIELHSLNNDQQLKALKRGELDLCFIRDNIQHRDGIHSQLVLSEPLIFILPKQHPLAKLERIPLEALNNIDFIIPAADQARVLNQHILQFAKQHQIQFNIIQSADTVLSNITSVALNLGCSILPNYVSTLLPENCVMRPLDIELPHFDLFMAYQSASKTPPVTTFIKALDKWFQPAGY